MFGVRIPPATKALTLANLTLGVIGCILHAMPTSDSGANNGVSFSVLHLQMCASPWSTRPWTLLSAAFAQSNFFVFVFQVAVFVPCARFLEHVYSSPQLLQFALVVNGVLSTFLVALTFIPMRLISSQYSECSVNGVTVEAMWSLGAGMIVAFKQLLPEHTVNLMNGLVSMRIKHLPFIYLISVTVIFLLTNNTSACLQSWYGAALSWLYLRYFRIQDGVRGDRSEAFALPTMFPILMQPPIRTVCRACTKILVSLKIIDLASDQKPVLPILSPRIVGSSAENAEAERRRALALKTIETRMQQSLVSPTNITSNASTPVTTTIK